METVIRVVIIYLFVLAAMRVIGKREFGQLAPHEFVVLLLIPEIVSTSLNLGDPTLTNAIVGVSTVLVLVFLTSQLTQLSPVVQKLVSDSETVLIHKGKLFEDAMNRERVTSEEIMTEARKSGVDSVEQIRWAILEADGKISIVPEEQGAGSQRTDDSAGSAA